MVLLDVAGPPAPPVRLGRAAVLAVLEAALGAAGAVWAWQGPAGAAHRWAQSSGPADLDLWWDPDPAQRAGVLDALRRLLGAAVVAETTDPCRLRHTSLAVETEDGLAVVDLTEGDLRVGPVLLLAAGDVRTRQTADGPRLAGSAAAADLLLRPLLRGRVPDPERLEEARRAWSGLDEVDRRRSWDTWRRAIGSVADEVVGVLAGAQPAEGLAGRVRRRLLVASVAPRALGSTWRSRASVLPAGSAAGPLGARTRGVVVALVGTDGAGKSTVARELAQRLERAGFETHSAYFGMARGNLPGVDLARRVLGIAPAGTEAPQPPVAVGESDPGASAAGLGHPWLRRAAAWVYAAEYGWRYARLVAPARRRRAVVICDRYVYDLRESPWPGSPAAAAARRLVPRPDVLVLPDAPAHVLHARKPERPLAEQAAAQRALRALLDEQPARARELVLDTSGATADPVAALLCTVVEVAHGHARR